MKMTPKKQPHYYASGFSMVELMVAIVVTLIVGIASAALFSYMTASATKQRDDIELQRGATTGIFALTRDLSNAGFMLRCRTTTTNTPSCAQLIGTNLVTGKLSQQAITTTTTNIDVGGTTLASTNITIHQAPVAGAFVSNAVTSGAANPTSITYAVERSEQNGVPLYSLQRTESSFVTGQSSSGTIGQNVLAITFQYAVQGSATYSATLPADTLTLTSIKLGMLTRSPFPDLKYTSPSTITWLGGTFTVPSTERNYRYEVHEKVVTPVNLQFTNP